MAAILQCLSSGLSFVACLLALVVLAPLAALGQDLNLDVMPRLKFSAGSIGATSKIDYFTSDANYEPEGGQFTRLEDGRNLTNLQAINRLYFDFNKHVSVYGLAVFSRTTAEDPDFTRSKFGFSELGLGARYRFAIPWFAVIPEFEVLYPMSKVSEDGDEAIYGEGVLSARIGTWFESHLWRLVLQSYIAYQYRDDGRSHLLKWQFGPYFPYQGFRFGFAFGGYESVVKDRFSSEPGERLIVTDAVNASSLKFYSVDPSLIEFQVYSSFSFNDIFQIGVGYGQSINGSSTAAGQTFSAYLSLNLESVTGYESSEPPPEYDSFEPTPNERPAYEIQRVDEIKQVPPRSFVPENQGDDQAPFREAERELETQPPQATKRPPLKKKPVQKKKIKKKKSQQQMLNELEQNLETSPPE